MFLFRRFIINRFVNNKIMATSQRCVFEADRDLQRQTNEESAPILYFDDASPPVRFVLMTAKCLNMKLNLYKIDLFKQENRTEFYKKKTPLQKVPVLEVNKQIIADSHAISMYLCDKYNDKELYSDDPLVRSKINEILLFNSGTLFPIDSKIFCEYFAGQTSIDQKNVILWNSALDYLETRLGSHSWLSGDKMTLSDLCCVATMSSLQVLVPLGDEHPRLTEWMRRMQAQPFYEINLRGLERLQNAVDLLK